MFPVKDTEGSLSSTMYFLLCPGKFHQLLFSTECRRVLSFQRYLHIILSLFSDTDRFIPSLGFSHPAAESSSDKVSYDDINDGCKSCLITTILSLSSSVSIYCGDHGRTTFRASITEFGSVEKTRGRGPLLKRNLSNSGRSSRRLFQKLLETT